MKEERENEENDSDDEQHSVGMQHPTNKRKSARRADELIRRQTQFGERAEASARLIDEKKVPRSMYYLEVLVLMHWHKWKVQLINLFVMLQFYKKDSGFLNGSRRGWEVLRHIKSF
jgi:hypothetical protein